MQQGPSLSDAMRIFWDHSPTGFIATADRGYIVFVNQIVCEMLGYTAEEMIGKHYAHFVPPDEHGALVDLDVRVARQRGRPLVFDLDHRAKDGSIWHAGVHASLHYEGDVLYLVHHLTDITKLRKAQANLELLEAVITHAQESIVLLECTPTDNERRILFANRSFTKLTGWLNSEVVGHSLAMLFGDQTDRRELAKINYNLKLFRAGRAELLVYGKGGHVFWIDMFAAPIQQHGRYTHWLICFRDITEQKHYVEALVEQKNRAEAANHSKSEFLANMSHELRTPMNAIVGFSEMMTARVFGANVDKYVEYAKDIHYSGQHLLSIINDLLDMSKIESGHYELEETEFLLKDVVVESFRFIEMKAQQKQIALSHSGVEVCNHLYADRRAIKQILINLLSNAVKFTEPGGGVAMTLARETEWLNIAVEDTGIGMSQRLIEQIGNKFVQGDTTFGKKYEGTGLGLSLVKELVEMHGGKIRFDSELNKGTVVHVALPRSRCHDEVSTFMRGRDVRVPSGSD